MDKIGDMQTTLRSRQLHVFVQFGRQQQYHYATILQQIANSQPSGL